MKTREGFDGTASDKPAVEVLAEVKHLLFFLKNVLEEQFHIMALIVPFQNPLTIMLRKILGIDLAEVICFSQTTVDDATEWFHDIADQRHSLIEEAMIYTAIQVKAVK